MQWTPGNRGDIDDMRGRSGGGRAIPLGLGGFLVVLVLSWLSGTNLFQLLGTDTSPSQSVGTSGEVQTSPAEEKMVDFVGAVAKDTQDVWAEKLGSRYRRTSVALFRDAVESGCGFAQSATGPFYCPQDGKVYLDLGFFSELDRRFGAPGDFAQAYVIAHEFGHHVQTLLGLNERASEAGGRAPTAPRSRSSSRPIVLPASGGTKRRGRDAPRPARWSSIRATSKKRCARRRRLATTGCRR
jgi:predicted metalloprotease